MSRLTSKQQARNLEKARGVGNQVIVYFKKKLFQNSPGVQEDPLQNGNTNTAQPEF
jgi:hypothetical protein